MTYRFLFAILMVLLISCGENNDINDIELLFPYKNGIYALDLTNGKLKLEHKIDEIHDIKKVYSLPEKNRYLVEISRPYLNEIYEINGVNNELNLVARGSNLMNGFNGTFFYLKTNDYNGALLASINVFGANKWITEEIGTIRSGHYISIYDDESNIVYFTNTSDMESVYYYVKSDKSIVDSDNKCIPVFFRSASRKLICSSRDRLNYYLGIEGIRIRNINGMPIYYDKNNYVLVVVKPSVMDFSVGIYNIKNKKTYWLWNGMYPGGGYVRKMKR
jgi:hypothetical protein